MNLAFRFKMIFQKNQNGLEVAVTTKSTTSALTMDTQFNVISSTFNVLEDALIQKINYDQRLSNRNQFDEIEFNFFLNKKHIRKKKVFFIIIIP